MPLIPANGQFTRDFLDALGIPNLGVTDLQINISVNKPVTVCVRYYPNISQGNALVETIRQHLQTGKPMTPVDDPTISDPAPGDVPNWWEGIN